ncbi:MAG: hypothetical protein JOZ19_03475 [Rubrobacter sp.]|nr:hypothetical protein [Rubrobacter sp.]
MQNAGAHRLRGVYRSGSGIDAPYSKAPPIQHIMGSLILGSISSGVPAQVIHPGNSTIRAKYPSSLLVISTVYRRRR